MKGGRLSGVLIPLFSMRSAASWGIGEFPDLAGVAAWLKGAGQSFVQLLPINEMPPGERSPYSSMTAMALDPIYIAVSKVPDFEALGGEGGMDAESQTVLAALRRSATLDYAAIRRLKEQWLHRAWDRFTESELPQAGERPGRFNAFVEGEGWWLEEYATFRALSAHFDERAWWDWPEPIAHRDPAALGELLATLEGEVGYRKYLQWIAAEQWAEARRVADPVKVMGDLPFMVSANSPDVWARQDQFRRDTTVGVPPDAFSETGQDWGLPPPRWDVMEQDDFSWVRARARRSADIYDGFRLDHLVGLYRTYNRPIAEGQEPFFMPAEEPQQTKLGETLVGIYRGTGAEITAEDLGTVPDFVRQSLTRLEVPGYKVLRWERQWNEPAQPFIDPSEYPEVGVATPGTHDSEPVAEWWREMSADDRTAVLQMPSIARLLTSSVAAAAKAVLPRAVLDALLRALLASPARLVILPIQDVFGWSDRINTPATVGEANWSWTMPWTAEALATEPEPTERAAALQQWSREAGRWEEVRNQR